MFTVAVACGPTPAGETTADTSSGTTPAESSSDGTLTGPTMGTSETNATTLAPTSPTTSGTTGEPTGTTTVGTTIEPTSTTTAISTTGPGTGSTTESVDSTTTVGSSSSTTSDTPLPAVCPTAVDCLPVFFEDENNDETDEESGWLLCNEGSVYYREVALDCAHEVFWPACDGQPGSCATDADCPGNEACVDVWGSCQCESQCMSDSDCEDGQICVCAGRGNGGWLALKNWCVPSGCAGPEDCQDDCGCRGSEFFCGTLDTAACPTPTDECHDNADCGGNRCAWEPQEQRWTCQEWGFCE
ncbi:hypothetical protein [Nannocystis sp. SCPEA4]|uniref:hypothetical protein n=1 Tax=Nannocystis sp. SCPEA4 TaxID=2996787 RepID=UPI002270DCE1|nr:hypothetical protein [Nannocystis sp. SCPEA4]MCY1058877.1 hypothetical protein [Nannocystis sp. SCPEA4]